MKVSVFLGSCILGFVGLLVYQSNQNDQVDKTSTKASKKVSDNPIIQSAYHDCVVQSQRKLIQDNPDSPSEIMNLLLDTTWQTCHSAVVITCHRNFEGFSCQSMIDVFQPSPS